MLHRSKPTMPLRLWIVPDIATECLPPCHGWVRSYRSTSPHRPHPDLLQGSIHVKFNGVPVLYQYQWSTLDCGSSLPSTLIKTPHTMGGLDCQTNTLLLLIFPHLFSFHTSCLYSKGDIMGLEGYLKACLPCTFLIAEQHKERFPRKI